MWPVRYGRDWACVRSLAPSRPSPGPTRTGWERMEMDGAGRSAVTDFIWNNPLHAILRQGAKCLWTYCGSWVGRGWSLLLNSAATNDMEHTIRLMTIVRIAAAYSGSSRHRCSVIYFWANTICIRVCSIIPLHSMDWQINAAMSKR